jgi:hypothetical protein
MPPVQTLQIGVPITLVEDVIYALPVRGSILFVDPEDAPLEVASDYAFTNAVAVTPTAEGYLVTAAPFIRATDAGATIIAKAND